VSNETKEAVRPLLAQGIAALTELARFDPYVAGPTLTLADFSVAFHLPPISIAAKAIYGESVLGGMRGARAHQELMDQRECVQRVRSEQLADQSVFMNRRT
jgi:glutathione S-transferase